MAGRGGRTNWQNAACYDAVPECSPYCFDEIIQDKISEPIKEVINLNPNDNEKIIDVVDINSEAYVSNCDVTVCDNYVMIDGFVKKNIIYSYIEDCPLNRPELRPCTATSCDCVVLETCLGNLIAWYPFRMKVKVCDASVIGNARVRCITVSECLNSDRFIYEECPLLTLPGIFFGAKVFPIIGLIASDLITVELACSKMKQE